MGPYGLGTGLPLGNKLRNNAKVMKHPAGAAFVCVSISQFASLLLNPIIVNRVDILAKDTAKLGAPEPHVSIAGQ